MQNQIVQGKRQKNAHYCLSRKSKIIAVAIVSSMFSLIEVNSPVFADDTEIFTAHTSTSPNSNIVFVIDTSGSMNSVMPGDPEQRTKIQVVKDVFEKLIFDPNNPSDHTTLNPLTQGLNFALMRFDSGANNSNNSNGGFFLTDMLTLDDTTKGDFWTAVNSLTAGGFTPLAETAYEAALYFNGDRPRFGNSSTPRTNASGITNGANGPYISPFRGVNNETQCSINNHLVILTDGMPTEDGDADTEINALEGTTPDCAFSDSNNTDCLPQVAQYLYNKDFVPGVPDVQSVKTHTIAFDLRGSGDSAAVELLRRTAEDYGGGRAENANSATELADAIGDIFLTVARSATSFVSPAVSIDSYSRYTHNNNVYFGLFQPEVAPQWTGNLKGYQIGNDGQLKDFSDPPVDAFYIDPDTQIGRFSSTAKSRWHNSVVDGTDIALGGAAARILTQVAVNTRNTFTQAPNNNLAVIPLPFTDVAQLSAANFGSNISNDEKTSIIQWAISRNNNPIGAPLHSNPQVVSYGGNVGDIVFFGTNQGFLHAINAESGNEVMSFIPSSMLRNLKTFRDNVTGNDHPYGLDGPITVFRKDANNNGVISPDDTGDIVLIIVGMRRGGSDYIALNVTDPDRPTVQWHISGGTGDFAEMAQSWSRAVPAKLNFGSTANPTLEDVLLISGGYDSVYDELNNPINNPSGAAVYAVNLLTGSCEWIAANNPANDICNRRTSVPFNHAIPSDVSAIHTNSDGVIDRLYVIDIMGYLYRIDMNNIVPESQGSTNLIYQPVGQLFANLSGGNRRYYYSVDVVYINRGFTPTLHLNVGSGHRAHPLADSQDNFFSIFDTNVFETSLPANFSTITIGSLTDQTNLSTESTITNGWYFTVPAGEKVLSTASSQSGYVFFTTYDPPAVPETPSCTPVLGSGKLYAVSVYDSSPLSNSRSMPLATIGIPPSPTFMTINQTTNSDNEVVSIGTRRIVLVGGQNPLSDEDEDKLNQGDTSKTYWQIVN